MAICEENNNENYGENDNVWNNEPEEYEERY